MNMEQISSGDMQMTVRKQASRCGAPFISNTSLFRTFTKRFHDQLPCAESSDR